MSRVEKEKVALVKSLANRLSAQSWVSNQHCLGVEDVLAWRALYVKGKAPSLPKTVADWFDKCSKDPMFQEAIDLMR